jgi:hypothetical protein
MDLTGTHAARALTAVLSETKKGDPQVVVDLELLDIEGQKPHIAWYGYFSEKTEDRTIESLRICGWTGNDFANITVGAEVQLVIESEVFEGKTHQKVKWVNRPGGVAMAKPMDAGKTAAFAAKMKGKLLAFDQKSGTPAKPKPAPSGANPPPPSDSDAPPF